MAAGRRAPGAAAAAVGLADLLITRVAPPPLPLLALYDWSAHLATTHLLLAAAAGPDYPRRHRRLATAALAATVLVDLDHLPTYLGLTSSLSQGRRPGTHGLLGLAGLAATVIRHDRRTGAAVLAGAALHLVRDLATGPGVPLLWPVARTSVRVPYPGYAAVVVGAAAVAMVRRPAAAGAAPAG